MEWLEAVKGFLVILPKLWGLVEGLGKLAKDAAFNKWLDDLEETTKRIENAETLRDRVEAAKRLASLTRRG